MKNVALVLSTLLILSCSFQDLNFSNPSFDPNSVATMRGYFTLSGMNNESNPQNGEVFLEISHGGYFTTTDVHPFSRGRGILSVNNNIITFTDTLLLIVPAIYSPSWVPSGSYLYEYDGEKLILEQDRVRYVLEE